MGKLLKIGISLLTTKNGRKTLSKMLLVAMAPLLLVLLIVSGGADGAAQHNNHLIDVLFNQKEVSSSAPVEYQEFIQNYKVIFSEIDDEITSLQNVKGFADTTLMKSIILASSLDKDSNAYLLDLKPSEYIKNFYEEVEIELDDNQVEQDSTITSFQMITDIETILSNTSKFLNVDMHTKKVVMYEIYYVVLTGRDKPLDGFVPMKTLLKDAYIESVKTNYIGGEFGSPFKDDWRDDVTSEFGPRDPITLPDGTKTGDMHRGIDFGKPLGTPISSVADGKVVAVQYTDVGLGFFVVIDHRGGVFTVYGHNSRILVAQGNDVKKGQIIAEVGSTGASTGAHLHFEVIVNKQHVNPRVYLK
ncbi:M23 family metallopeptidase [Erysipelothrix anatis]|uniref:M23 family metallopeptidase n=1 Tax=Erysipelothrix anatis TaxID=2683713 RepID=UPI00135AAEDB|nr:M23 family metallopeptidase [Erysipelothrix anatis]